MGYRALKWDPFEAARPRDGPAQRTRTIAIVEAVRDAVGPDIDLMLDVHGRLNVPTAIAMCRALARFDLTWIEEPTPPESIDALAEVRANSPGADRRRRALVRADALPRGAVARRRSTSCSPTSRHAGGLGETKRIAHLAHLHLIPVAPHNPVGPVMNAMTLHTAVAIPNFSIFETVSIDVPWRKELVNGDARLRGRRPPGADGAGPRRRAQRGGLRALSL